MAGHSKWKQIKHYKAATDAKRGALFTKLIREITVAAKADIERAVKKGTGELEGVDYQEATYEAYGPGGVALLIQALTDNPTRTVADVRAKLSRNGGNMGTAGSVAFLFDRKGQMQVDANRHDEDTVMEAALDAGAEDVARDEDVWVVTSEPAMLHAVREGLQAKGIETTEAAINWVPKNTVRVEGGDAQALVKLIDALEDLDDVQKVEGNFDIDAEALAEA